MIIYNITLKVDHEVVEQWTSWMLSEHMPEVLHTECFTGYVLSRILEQDEVDGITFSAQYFCNDMVDYNRYIASFATTMREKAHHKFGGRFVAFRTVMERVGAYWDNGQN